MVAAWIETKGSYAPVAKTGKTRRSDGIYSQYVGISSLKAPIFLSGPRRFQSVDIFYHYMFCATLVSNKAYPWGETNYS
jgi:hypothetical protein